MFSGSGWCTFAIVDTAPQLLDPPWGNSSPSHTWSHLSAHSHNSGWTIRLKVDSLSLSPEHANPADPPPGLLHQGHRRLARNLRCLRLSQVFNSGPKTIYNAKFVKIKNVKSVSNSTWQKPCSAWWSLQSSTPCLTFQRPEPGFTNVVLVGEGCKKRPV